MYAHLDEATRHLACQLAGFGGTHGSHRFQHIGNIRFGMNADRAS